MASEWKTWVAVCRYCGKEGAKMSAVKRPAGPSPSTVSGKCPDKRNGSGKHVPVWEER